MTSSTVLVSPRAALTKVFSSALAELDPRLELGDGANATYVSSIATAAFGRAVHRLIAGLPVRMYVVGGSAAAGAGGAGVNHTFDAQLASRLNELLERAEATSRRPLGRVMRTSVAQGGTTSFWAALMADALHGRSAHILVWEYAINDHSVSLEAAGRGASAAASLGPPTMRYMIDAWLRRSLSYRPPPLLMLTYLWDKQPAAPFKAGNRALCRHMPVPSSAYDAQRSQIEHFGRAGAGVAAVNVAGYVSTRRHGRFCPLVADSYFHPSAEGHALVADLLSAVLLGLLRSPERASSAAVSAAVDSSAEAAVNVNGVTGAVSPSTATAGASAGWPPPLSLPWHASATTDGVSARLDALLRSPSMRAAVTLAWEPQAEAHLDDTPRYAEIRRDTHLDDTPSLLTTGTASAPTTAPAAVAVRFALGQPPPVVLFAKSVRERADRKWMWLAPPCTAENASELVLQLPAPEGGRRVRALSYFAMVSPGARLRHKFDGQPVEFAAVQGSFLAQSWGYLQQWHVLDGAAPREWRLCNEPVPNARCVGWRCGLEFKMPMKTVGIGWFLTLATT